jgi:hypothetical protein
VVEAWGSLSEPIRRAVLALIETALPDAPGMAQNATE